MNGEVICGQCPAVYPPSEIEACIDEKPVKTLAQLQQGDSQSPEKSRSRNFFRSMIGLREEQPVIPTEGPNLEDLDRLRPYTFKCPHGHVVDGNAGSQFGVAVLGASGASKSHILPAIVRELDDMSALRPVGVTLRDSLYPNPKLTKDVTDVFRRGTVLGMTAPEAAFGPYSYKLQINPESPFLESSPYSLLLYDIAGENLAAITRIIEKAAFILLCKALIVLIDPQGFLPTQFDENAGSERVRLDAGRDVRGNIRVIADTLTEVWRLDDSKELSIPIVFVLAKADAIDWVGDYEWSKQTEKVLGACANGDGNNLTRALQDSSAATRAAFEQLGGGLVIDEIEERFDPDCIRFAAASATSSMPLNNPEHGQTQWEDDPTPNGVALALLHLLDLAGLTRQPVAEAVAD